MGGPNSRECYTADDAVRLVAESVSAADTTVEFKEGCHTDEDEGLFVLQGDALARLEAAIGAKLEPVVDHAVRTLRARIGKNLNVSITLEEVRDVLDQLMNTGGAVNVVMDVV